MSIAKIQKSIFNGDVTVPASKSVAHRALICSFLAGGGTVKPIISSKDMQATVGIIEALKNNETELNSIESGSTLRFMIPVAAALGKEVTFTGQGSLLTRPIGEYLELLPLHGVKINSDGYLPAEISGKLQNGSFEVNGNVSSQYITGLLLALSALEGDSAVILKTQLQSKPYVDMTVKVLADYGVNVFETDFGYLIKGGQKFKVQNYTVEGDWSQAAFFLVGGAINGDVTVNGLDMNSTQGDKAVVDVIKKFGANVTILENAVRVQKSELHGIEFDATDIPDMVPAIAVLASFASGKTVIKGAQRLRYKESDRIESVVYNLKELGVDVKETPDGMEIGGGRPLHSAKLKGYNDHRIVMAFSVAAMNIGDCEIDDAQSINKSYPSFFDDYNKLGGKADVL